MAGGHVSFDNGVLYHRGGIVAVNPGAPGGRPVSHDNGVSYCGRGGIAADAATSVGVTIYDGKAIHNGIAILSAVEVESMSSFHIFAINDAIGGAIGGFDGDCFTPVSQVDVAWPCVCSVCYLHSAATNSLFNAILDGTVGITRASISCNIITCNIVNVDETRNNCHCYCIDPRSPCIISDSQSDCVDSVSTPACVNMGGSSNSRTVGFIYNTCLGQ